MAKSGYINGSDLLIKVGSACVGHATSHTTTLSAETKERAVKPALSGNYAPSSLYKDKSVISKSASIKVDGIRNYSESEGGFKTLLNAFNAGTPVTVEAFERAESSSSSSAPTPYLTGSFVITSLEESAPAQDDATYSATLESTGAITITASALTGETLSSSGD